MRASIRVNPATAQVTVLSDPFPTILHGIPLDIRTVNVTVNRPGFHVQPDELPGVERGRHDHLHRQCDRSGLQPLRGRDCADPAVCAELTASVGAHASKANGTSFNVKLESAGIGQAISHRWTCSSPQRYPSPA